MTHPLELINEIKTTIAKLEALMVDAPTAAQPPPDKKYEYENQIAELKLQLERLASERDSAVESAVSSVKELAFLRKKIKPEHDKPEKNENEK